MSNIRNINDEFQSKTRSELIIQSMDPSYSNYSKPSTIKQKQGTTKHQLKILVVDDDICVADTFGEILTNRGHTVTVVTNAINCLSKCQNDNFDVIFMDFHLKDDKKVYDEINGAEITDLLKTVCSVNSIVFAITGDDSQTAIKKFKDVGMNGALIKPLDIETIGKLMNSLEIRRDINKKTIKITGNYQLKKNLIIFD